MNWNEFKENVEHWAEDRGIYDHSTADTQLLKALSELGGLADAVIKDDREALKDAIGDVAVCIVNYSRMINTICTPYFSEKVFSDDAKISSCTAYLAQLIAEMLMGYPVASAPYKVVVALHGISVKESLDFMDCCATAWHEIKDRKGKMVPGGAFVKED